MTAQPILSTRDLRATHAPGAAQADRFTSRGALWTGRIVTGLPSLFLMVDGTMKLFAPPVVVEGTLQYGYPESAILPIGIVLLISTVLHLIPRTAVLGAILLTGYLGGAVATHVRASDGWFNILFPAFFGCLIWGGLCLRNEKVRCALTKR